MAEQADAPDSKSGSERSVGSTPTMSTQYTTVPQWLAYIANGGSPERMLKA